MAIKNLEKMDIYNPTNYVNNSEPDIDADNLNKTENKLEETVAKANEIIDALKTLISTVQTNSDNTVPSSSLAYAMQQEITKNKEDIATANSNFDYSSRPDITSRSEAMQAMWDRLFPAMLYLYNLGNEYFDVTGGWIDFNYRPAGGIATKNSDNLFVKTTVQYGGKGFKTVNPIDITDFKKFTVNFSTTGNNTVVGMWRTSNILHMTETGYEAPIMTFHQGDNDISTISGNVYFAIAAWNSNDAVDSNLTLRSMQLLTK